MSSMTAVQLVQIGRPLEACSVPVPVPAPREILVRVAAAGICHSDVHYRAGVSPAGPLPLTLGHEVAGTVVELGPDATGVAVDDRVCLHYLITCGQCAYCHAGTEQFCTSGQMLGKHRDGGYAEYICVPARSVFPLPAEIPFEQGAVMMCSSATAFHALRKGKVQAGDHVAVFGAGGLGMSAIQLAQTMGALSVTAVDVDPGRLALAERLGARPVHAGQDDGVTQLRTLGSHGIDVALDFVGQPAVIRQALATLAPFGRLVAVGLGDQPVPIYPYAELINREVEIIGCSDHLAAEIPLLTELVRRRALDLAPVVTETIPLQADAINSALDRLERYAGAGVRTVIVPQSR